MFWLVAPLFLCRLEDTENIVWHWQRRNITSRDDFITTFPWTSKGALKGSVTSNTTNMASACMAEGVYSRRARNRLGFKLALAMAQDDQVTLLLLSMVDIVISVLRIATLCVFCCALDASFLYNLLGFIS